MRAYCGVLTNLNYKICFADQKVKSTIFQHTMCYLQGECLNVVHISNFVNIPLLSFIQEISLGRRTKINSNVVLFLVQNY